MKLEQWIAIAIAAAPVVGYGVAYYYEVGKCHIYGIPREIIQLNITDILFAISFIILYYLIMGFTFLTGFLIYGNGKTLWRTLVAPLPMLLMPAIPLIIINFSDLKQWIVYVILCIIFWSIFVIIAKRHKAEKYSDPTFQIKLLIIVLLGLYAPFVAYRQGNHDASFQREFFTPSSAENITVLRIYGDSLICTDNISIYPSDSGAKVYTSGNIFILNRNSNQNLRLLLKTIE